MAAILFQVPRLCRSVSVQYLRYLSSVKIKQFDSLGNFAQYYMSGIRSVITVVTRSTVLSVLVRTHWILSV
jgi:hypothetical protein